MRRTLIALLTLTALLALAIAAPLGQASDFVIAQQATAVPTTAGSTVQIFFIACETTAVLNFSGQMNTGYDVYYQVFNASAAALTNLRRVQVSGAYQVSDTATYTPGLTLPAGQGASVRVSIARETDSSSSVFDTTVNDVQDGCNSPQFAPGTSLDTGSVGAAPQPGSPGQEFQEIPSGIGSGILSPFGGYYNASYVQQPLVTIGPRRTDLPTRTSNPGLIFAECNDYWPAADPGLLYDTDQIVIFWSWFTATLEQMQQHLAAAQYSVTLNDAIFINVEVTEPQIINGDYWVFWIARVGNLVPGYYGVAYELTWSEPHFDGYDDYGPGTGNEILDARCDFQIFGNTTGATPAHNRSYAPWTTPNGDQPAISR
jgi:hypothetical protein